MKHFVFSLEDHELPPISNGSYASEYLGSDADEDIRMLDQQANMNHKIQTALDDIDEVHALSESMTELESTTIAVEQFLLDNDHLSAGKCYLTITPSFESMGLSPSDFIRGHERFLRTRSDRDLQIATEGLGDFVKLAIKKLKEKTDKALYSISEGFSSVFTTYTDLRARAVKVSTAAHVNQSRGITLGTFTASGFHRLVFKSGIGHADIKEGLGNTHKVASNLSDVYYPKCIEYYTDLTVIYASEKMPDKIYSQCNNRLKALLGCVDTETRFIGNNTLYTTEQSVKIRRHESHIAGRVSETVTDWNYGHVTEFTRDVISTIDCILRIKNAPVMEKFKHLEKVAELTIGRVYGKAYTDANDLVVYFETQIAATVAEDGGEPHPQHIEGLSKANSVVAEMEKITAYVDLRPFRSMLAFSQHVFGGLRAAVRVCDAAVSVD